MTTLTLDVMTRLNKIMIVDDNDTTNYVTKLFLEKMDAVEVCEVAQNGKEAVDLLLQEGMVFPELILLDINMPIMDGFDFLRAWEKNGWTSKSKIAMFTSSIHPDDQKRAAQFFDVIAYVEKPLNQEKLQSLFRKVENRSL